MKKLIEAIQDNKTEVTDGMVTLALGLVALAILLLWVINK
jgi:hypothetical protein